jgi:S-adenosylmethionine decarboxylase
LNKPYQPHSQHNLTRSLGFNAYRVFTADSAEDLLASVKYLDDLYDSAFLENLLEDVAALIGAKILNASTATYEPSGSSVALLLADAGHQIDWPERGGKSLLGHLDKSHLTVHTYPQLHLDTGLCSLRLDFDLATCGTISPLIALPLLLDRIFCDLVVLDFRVRGYQPKDKGNFDYGADDIVSISKHLSEAVTDEYHIEETSLLAAQIFHSRLMRKDLQLAEHILPIAVDNSSQSLEILKKHLKRLFNAS